MATATFTEFLREPKRVIRELDRSRRVVIERRDADDLVLMNARQDERAAEGTEIVALLLGRALSNERVRDALGETLVDTLTQRLPWLRFLPDEARGNFTREFLATAQAAAAAGNNAAVAQVLREWKATAEIYSDPALLADLRRPLAGPPLGTLVSRPRPGRRPARGRSRRG